MKIRLIHIILLLLVSCSVTAQSGFEKDLEIAHAYEEIGETSNALKFYFKCYKKKPSKPLACSIANCYTKLREFNKAYTFLEETPYAHKNEDDVLLKLADLNIILGQYFEAKKILLDINDSKQNQLIENKMAACDSSLKWISESNNNEIVNVTAINSEYSEVAPSWYNEGIIFSSTRESVLIKKKSGVDNQEYYDLYYAKMKDSTFKSPSNFSTIINSSDHEVGICFSKNEDHIIFTRSTHKEYNPEIDDHINHLKLYKSSKTKLGWSPPKVFVMNDSTSSFGHPCYGHNDQVFVFSSNLPGGYGGTDLYISFKIDSSWTVPENMGPNINTSANEYYPFFDQHDRFYFTSNGHIGLGGYDIFTSEIIDGEWSRALNLKLPINSSYDDFGLIRKEDSNKVYFSSNRPGGLGKDDIYQSIIK